MITTPAIKVNQSNAAPTEVQMKLAIAQVLSLPFAYNSPVIVVDFEVGNRNVIKGRFKDASRLRIFEFEIDDSISFKPFTQKRIDSADIDLVAWEEFSKGYTYRYDAAKTKRKEKPKCGNTSYNCGKACIGLNKNCKSDPTDKPSQEKIDKVKAMAGKFKAVQDDPTKKQEGNKLTPKPPEEIKQVTPIPNKTEVPVTDIVKQPSEDKYTLTPLKLALKIGKKSVNLTDDLDSYRDLKLTADPVLGWQVINKNGDVLREPPNGNMAPSHRFKKREQAEKFANDVMTRVEKLQKAQPKPDVVTVTPEVEAIAKPTPEPKPAPIPSVAQRAIAKPTPDSDAVKRAISDIERIKSGQILLNPKEGYRLSTSGGNDKLFSLSNPNISVQQGGRLYAKKLTEKEAVDFLSDKYKSKLETKSDPKPSPNSAMSERAIADIGKVKSGQILLNEKERYRLQHDRGMYLLNDPKLSARQGGTSKKLTEKEATDFLAEQYEKGETKYTLNREYLGGAGYKLFIDSNTPEGKALLEAEELVKKTKKTSSDYRVAVDFKNVATVDYIAKRSANSPTKEQQEYNNKQPDKIELEKGMGLSEGWRSENAKRRYSGKSEDITAHNDVTGIPWKVTSSNGKEDVIVGAKVSDSYDGEKRQLTLHKSDGTMSFSLFAKNDKEKENRAKRLVKEITQGKSQIVNIDDINSMIDSGKLPKPSPNSTGVEEPGDRGKIDIKNIKTESKMKPVPELLVKRLEKKGFKKSEITIQTGAGEAKIEAMARGDLAIHPNYRAEQWTGKQTDTIDGYAVTHIPNGLRFHTFKYGYREMDETLKQAENSAVEMTDLIKSVDLKNKDLNNEQLHAVKVGIVQAQYGMTKQGAEEEVAARDARDAKEKAEKSVDQQYKDIIAKSKDPKRAEEEVSMALMRGLPDFHRDNYNEYSTAIKNNTVPKGYESHYQSQVDRFKPVVDNEDFINERRKKAIKGDYETEGEARVYVLNKMKEKGYKEHEYYDSPDYEKDYDKLKGVMKTKDVPPPLSGSVPSKDLRKTLNPGDKLFVKSYVSERLSNPSDYKIADGGEVLKVNIKNVKVRNRGTSLNGKPYDVEGVATLDEISHVIRDGKRYKVDDSDSSPNDLKPEVTQPQKAVKQKSIKQKAIKQKAIKVQEVRSQG